MGILSKRRVYLYIAGQVIAIIGGMLIMGTGFFASPILIMIFPAAFIVMYAVNLKHMK